MYSVIRKLPRPLTMLQGRVRVYRTLRCSIGGPQRCALDFSADKPILRSKPLGIRRIRVDLAERGPTPVRSGRSRPGVPTVGTQLTRPESIRCLSASSELWPTLEQSLPELAGHRPYSTEIGRALANIRPSSTPFWLDLYHVWPILARKRPELAQVRHNLYRFRPELAPIDVSWPEFSKSRPRTWSGLESTNIGPKSAKHRPRSTKFGQV